MFSRRQFLSASGTAAAAAVAATFRDDSEARVMAASAAVQNHTAGAVAANEDYWREIQQAFTLDRTIINLNNGGCCPSPRVVHEAFKRYLDISNQAPVYHMWQMLEPNIETRAAAARRGVRLRSRGAGDHAQRERGAADRAARHRSQGRATRSSPPTRTTAACSTPGSSASAATASSSRRCRSRCRRRRIDELADRLLGAITPATKVLHFCHITNLTGQIFPVKRICDEARRRGIKTIVDGAHAFAHFPVQGRRSRLRLLRHQPAQVAAGADRHRLPLRPPREHRDALAADAGRGGRRRRHPQVRGDRHAPGGEPQRDRRGARVSRRHRHRAQGGAAALPARSLGDAARSSTRRSRIHTKLDPAHSCAIGTVQIVGVPTPKVVERLWDTLADHRHADRPRGVRGRARSRRTSTRRSKRSTRSRRRWRRSPRRAPTDRWRARSTASRARLRSRW